MSLNARILVLLGLALPLPLMAVPACTISASPVSFGSYSHLDAFPADSSGSLSLECQEVGLLTDPTLLNYEISLSTGGAGSYNPRQLASGAQALNYNLYTDLSRSVIWGDGTSGTSTQTGMLLVPGCVLMICPTVQQNETVYSRAPAGQIVPAGSYSDAITVTVTY